jgi:pimeloyl-ACP methyl ester carboxylesterase
MGQPDQYLVEQGPSLYITPAMTRRLSAAGATLCALGTLAYVAICSYMALTLTRPERQPFRFFPEQYGLTYESVSFPSRVDAIPLDGWLLSPPVSGASTRPTIVVVHGKGVDRTREAHDHMLEIADHLVRGGHRVLLFDLRGSGRSGGERFTLGAQEVRDVGGAIDFLQSRGLANDGVHLLGYSMGAATAMMLSPKEPLVRSLVEDSGYAELGGLLEERVPQESGLPPFFTPGMVFMARALVGMDMYAIRPIDAIPALATRGTPLLVIHGDADQSVPFSHAGRILAAR